MNLVILTTHACPVCQVQCEGEEFHRKHQQRSRSGKPPEKCLTVRLLAAVLFLLVCLFIGLTFVCCQEFDSLSHELILNFDNSGVAGLTLKCLLRQVMPYNTFKQDNHSTVGGDGGCRVGEVRAGTTFPIPDQRVLRYSNCQRSPYSMSKRIFTNLSLQGPKGIPS